MAAQIAEGPAAITAEELTGPITHVELRVGNDEVGLEIAVGVTREGAGGRTRGADHVI